MLGQLEEVTADQRGLIALALGPFVVVAVPFQRPLGQVLAAAAVEEATGVVVVLQVRLEVTLKRRFHGQARFLEVVIPTGHTAGASLQAQAEALDHRLIGDQPGVLLVGHRRQRGKHRLVVAEHQHMAVRAVLEVIVDAFLFAEALDEMQVALVVLHAVLAFGIDHRAEVEAMADAGENAMFLEHPGDDLRHGQVLENALVAAVGEIGELRYERQAVAGQAPAGLSLGDAMDQAVNAAAVRGEGEKRRLMQQRLQLQVGAFADQFDLEGEGRRERLAAAEFEHLQVVRDRQLQAEMGLVGRVEHSLFLRQSVER